MSTFWMNLLLASAVVAVSAHACPSHKQRPASKISALFTQSNIATCQRSSVQILPVDILRIAKRLTLNAFQSLTLMNFDGEQYWRLLMDYTEWATRLKKYFPNTTELVFSLIVTNLSLVCHERQEQLQHFHCGRYQISAFSYAGFMRYNRDESKVTMLDTWGYDMAGRPTTKMSSDEEHDLRETFMNGVFSSVTDATCILK